MEFIIKREDLLKSLQLVSGAVERRQTMPILSNVMLVVKDNHLSIVATDLELELVGYINLEYPSKEQGRITASARKLIDICKTLPDQAEITLKTIGNRLILQSGKSHFTLSTLPVEGFPSLEETAGQIEFSLPQSKLKNILSRIYFSMAQGDVRYYLNGMSFDFDKKALKLVTADGHRLSLASFVDKNIPEHSIQVVVPQKGIMELMRLLADVEKKAKFVICTNHIRVETEDFTFTSKLIDTKCPNYMSVIPKNGDKTAVINRNLLKQALTRVSILSNEKYRGVYLVLTKNVLRLFANNPEQEEAEEEMAIDYQGTDLEIGFNAGYLLDICNAVTASDLAMIFSSPSDGVLIEGVGDKRNYIYVVMPLQI
jgi:DNA polymerase-3 subunit beta